MARNLCFMSFVLGSEVFSIMPARDCCHTPACLQGNFALPYCFCLLSAPTAACRYRNVHEARETYKTLKDQNIGNAATCAQLYADWAAMESSAGEVERALSVLRKGIKAGAQPPQASGPVPSGICSLGMACACDQPSHTGLWALLKVKWDNMQLAIVCKMPADYFLVMWTVLGSCPPHC